MKINNVTNFHFNNHGNYIEITAGEQPVNLTLSAPGEVTLNGWYTLDGTHLSAQPTRKGIYVNNGKKYIIK